MCILILILREVSYVAILQHRGQITVYATELITAKPGAFIATAVPTKKGLKVRWFRIYRDMSKYQNGKIYKIVDVGYNKCYIGSTCESLSQRMARHRYAYNGFLRNTCKLMTSFHLFKEFGVENCKIELIELLPCESSMELRKREGHYIKNTECVNKIIAGRSVVEYEEEEKETRRERGKQSKKKQYWERPEYFKEKVRFYNESHKEEQKKRDKAHYEKNKQVILQKQSIVRMCECGSEFTHNHKARHCRTQKHQNYLKQLEEQKEI